MPKGQYKRKKKIRVRKNITIPVTLAKLLTAKPEDVKTGYKVKDAQEIGRALLRVLVAVNK